MQEFVSERISDGHKLRNQPDYIIPRVNTVHNGNDSIRHLGSLIWQLVPHKSRFASSLSYLTNR